MIRLAPIAGVVGLLWLAAAPAAGTPTPMSDADLADQRGGIMTPIGIDIGFAANVRTFVDGQLALETTLTWTDQGPVTGTTGALAAAPVAGLPGGLSALLPGLSGGSTQILQDLSNQRIASVIVNSASDRNIRQDTDITLTIPQLQALQHGFAASRIASNLQGVLALSLPGGGSGH
ncbi:MAG: hypothetical protein ACHP9T_16955 [Caulobacterales bacterium]